MTAPDKLYVHTGAHLGMLTLTTIPVDAPGEETYIRKDIVDETIKTAEDHAYFAGQERFREKLIEWANKMLQDTADRLDFRGNKAFSQMLDKLNSM